MSLSVTLSLLSIEIFKNLGASLSLCLIATRFARWSRSGGCWAHTQSRPAHAPSYCTGFCARTLDHPMVAQVVEPLLPWALAFAAGCMIYVVFDDLVPEVPSLGGMMTAASNSV